MAQHGIEVLGWDDWAQADVCVVADFEEGQASKQYPLAHYIGTVLVVEHHNGYG